MNDLLREIDEELRYDRLRERWNAYGKPIIVVLSLVVLGLAARALWQNWERGEQAAAVEVWMQARQLADEDKYNEASQLAGDIDVEKEISAWVALQRAAWSNKSNSDAEQKNYINGILSDSNAEYDVRAMARLLQQDAASSDAGNATVDGPFATLMAEQRAMAAWQDNRVAEAAALLHMLTNDQSAPSALRSRATEMLAYIASVHPDIVGAVKEKESLPAASELEQKTEEAAPGSSATTEKDETSE